MTTQDKKTCVPSETELAEAEAAPPSKVVSLAQARLRAASPEAASVKKTEAADDADLTAIMRANADKKRRKTEERGSHNRAVLRSFRIKH